MKYQFSEKRILNSLIILPLLILFLSLGHFSRIHAFAAIYGRVYYQGPYGVVGLSRVIITDHTSKDIAEKPNTAPGELAQTNDTQILGIASTVTDGDGNFRLDGLDCGGLPSSKRITVDGFAGGPPPGVPGGGSFSPSAIALGDFNNATEIGPKPIIYTPPGPSATPLPPTFTPTPTPTLVPCGGPCNTDTQCDKECPVCFSNGTCQPPPSPTPTSTPTSTPTPTLVPCGGPCNSDTQCDKECPICSNNGTCAKPTSTPTPTPFWTCGTGGSGCPTATPIGQPAAYSGPTNTPTPRPDWNATPTPPPWYTVLIPEWFGIKLGKLTPYPNQ